MLLGHGLAGCNFIPWLIGISQFVFLIGKYFYALKDQFNALFFETPAEAATYIQQNPIENHLVLLKGSRGMKLESLLQYL